jgi:alkylation response protein AidB-like acyl-CoA dehydrogenase
MDVTTPTAPPEYDEFRSRLRAFIAEHAPKPPERRKSGMRTAETTEELDEVKTWLARLTEAGFGPRALVDDEDPWPRRIAIEELEAAHVAYVVGNPLIDSAIVQWGTAEQKERFLPGLRSGQDVWCQLYSEPGAGSDLAGLQTRAELDGDVYRINGQKVWTTWGQWADYGYLLARTDTNEKHGGITAFIIEMDQPGVQVRPLREVTGTSDFNEVFFTDAIIPVADRLGAEGEGWRISTYSLVSERSRQRGDYDEMLTDQLLDLVDVVGADAAEADELVRLYERAHILNLMELRVQSKEEHGQTGAADPAVLKMTFSQLNLEVAEAALRWLDSRSMLVDGDPRAVERGRWQDMFLYARGYTISAGSNEIMRNVIAERGLGMPRERVG